MTTMTKQDIIDYFGDQHVAEMAMYDDWGQPEDWENVTSKSVDQYGGGRLRQYLLHCLSV